MGERVIMLELSEEEFDSLLGHLEDDLELHGPYWATERGETVQLITKRMQTQARRVRGSGQLDAGTAEEAR